MINDQPRPEKTLATFVLPAGKHKLTVIKSRRRAEQAIDVKDGSPPEFDLEPNPPKTGTKE